MFVSVNSRSLEEYEMFIVETKMGTGYGHELEGTYSSVRATRR